MGKVDPTVKLLRAILARTGWKQYQLAQKLGCPHSTVSRWLNGVHKVQNSWRTAIENHPEIKPVIEKIRRGA